MAKKAKRTKVLRPGAGKSQGWQPNARRAAARKRAPAKERKEPAAIRTARSLVQGKRRTDHKAERIAPSSAVDLGPVVLPGPDDAVRVLRELAEVNDEAINAKKAWLEQQAKAKTAKAAYDDLMEQVQDKLRQATHKSELPILDISEREADQERMEAAGANGGAIEDDEPEPSPVH